MYFRIFLLTAFTALVGCETDNEHFCAKYEYVYNQLDDPELPTYGEMKEQLEKEIAERPNDHDQQKLMLFVLEDYHLEIKPAHLEPQAFCLQSERWKYY